MAAGIGVGGYSWLICFRDLYSVFGIRCSVSFETVFGIRYSVFGNQYSVFGIRYSVCYN